MAKIKTYENGLRLVVEEKEEMEGLAFEFFIKAGAKQENDSNRGIAHLIEHMMFKGTKKRTAKDISNDLADIGARINAGTSYNYTSYYTYSTYDEVETCVEIISDMLFNSTFKAKQLASEKKVVLEEIGMSNDVPGKTSFSNLRKVFFDGTSYKHPILGYKESLSDINKTHIEDFIKANYIPKNMIISFAGNISFKKAESLIEKYIICNLSSHKKEDPSVDNLVDNYLYPKSAFLSEYKDNKQAIVHIAMPAPNLASTKKHATIILSDIIGTGMSSRLFLKIREELGLVYAINTSLYNTEEGSLFFIGFSTSYKNSKKAIIGVKELLVDVIKEGFTQKELDKVKKNITTSIRLSKDDIISKSSLNVTHLSRYGRIKTTEEMLEKFNAVTLDDINNVAKDILINDHTLVSTVTKDPETDLLKAFNEIDYK